VSGRLLASITHKVIPGARVQVGTDDPHAKYHEFGTRGPYLIKPVRARTLSFMTSTGRAFARTVTHPGIPRRRILPYQKDTERIAKEVTRVYVRRLGGEG
jgi:hypothetical protein